MALPPIPSINGGTQAASNGDTALYGGAYNGRFSYSSGVPTWVVGAAVMVAALLFIPKGNSK